MVKYSIINDIIKWMVAFVLLYLIFSIVILLSDITAIFIMSCLQMGMYTLMWCLIGVMILLLLIEFKKRMNTDDGKDR